MQLSDSGIVTGQVTRRRYDTLRLAIARQAILTNEVPEEDAAKLLDWAAKPLFAENRLWKFINKYSGLDLKIPVVTGFWTLKGVTSNTITSVGKQISAQQVGGTTAAPVTAIAIGIGSPSATALGSEITTNGGQRGAATVTNQTTTTTGDTEQWVKTYSFTGTFAVTEEGLFDNNSSGGNMLASQSFSAINVISGDSVQFTHKVKYA